MSIQTFSHNRVPGLHDENSVHLPPKKRFNWNNNNAVNSAFSINNTDSASSSPGGFNSAFDSGSLSSGFGSGSDSPRFGSSGSGSGSDSSGYNSSDDCSTSRHTPILPSVVRAGVIRHSSNPNACLAYYYWPK